MRVLLIADDLTGAADSAAAFARPDAPVQVVAAGTGDDTLDATLAAANRRGSVLAIDTDTRDASPQQATERLNHLLARPAIRAHHGWTLLKVDSLLRGPIAAHVAALRAAGRAERIVCAPALPALGRTTRHGRQLVDGRPIDDRHRTDPRQPSHGASVADALGLDPADEPGLAIHDAASDNDLDQVLATLPPSPHARRPLLIGSAGLAGALDRHLGCDARPSPPTRTAPSAPTTRRPSPALVVSLSPTSTARAQVDRLRDERPDIVHVTVTPAMDRAERTAGAARLADALTAGADVALLTVEAAPAEGPAVARTRAALLSGVRAVLRLAGRWPAFIGNGGDATRCILDALDRTVFEVRAPLADGAISCLVEVAGDRRIRLITKSGSFGDPDALHRAVSTLAAVPTPT